MVLDYNITNNLQIKIKKICKKDPSLKKALFKKIEEIINSNKKTVSHYKFLKHNLKGLQRVHIKKKFVLIFKYNKQKNFLLFIDFDHHDKVYRL